MKAKKYFMPFVPALPGYILKNDPPHKYIEAINDVYNGGRAL
jgi:hypothetical protein